MDAKQRAEVRCAEPDAVLIERLAGGDLEALGDLYERHGPRVRAALAGMAVDIDFAEREELLQEVFLAVATAASSFRGESRFTTWLHGLTIRKARAHRRGKWTRRRIRERHGAECAGVSHPRDVSPERSVASREAVLAALVRLSAEQREIVWLHAVEEMTAAEIGAVLDISPRTVWTRLHRARKLLLGGAAEETGGDSDPGR